MRLQILSQIPSFNLLQFVSTNEIKQEEPIWERDSFSFFIYLYIFYYWYQREIKGKKIKQKQKKTLLKESREKVKYRVN